MAAGVEAKQPPSENGFFYRRSPVRKHGVLYIRTGGRDGNFRLEDHAPIAVDIGEFENNAA
jgi:hypothetical protein